MTKPSEETRAAAGMLEAAFPKVKLDPKSAVGDAKATFLDYQAFAKDSNGRDWSQLDWEYLELNREAIGFLTPKGLADYLPALLSAAIVHYDEVDVLPTFIAAGLTRCTDEPARLARFDELAGHLDESQQKAVATALAELHRLAANPHPEAVTKVALERSYWRKLLPKKKRK